MAEEITDFKPTSLDDLLPDSPEDPTPEKEAAKPDDKEVKAEAEPDKQPEKDEAKGEADKADKSDAELSADGEKDAPPASEPKTKDEKPTVPLAALEDERRKRQELEQKLSELDRKISEQKQEPRPDELEDPDGAAAWDKARASERDFQTRAALSQELMAELHDDYDEIEQIFVEEAAKNPALAVQWQNHAAPAKFAYQEGRRLKFAREVGDDPESYRERLKAELVPELKAELMKELKPDRTPVNTPESLAKEPSDAPREAGKAWDGPAPLDQLLPE